jgi:hypothetical protein
LADLYFWEFLLFFSADPLKLCQVEWGASQHSYFQVSPEMFEWVEVGALAGPLKDIETFPEATPVLSCWKVNLSPSRITCYRTLRTSRIFLYFAPFILPSILTNLPVPAAEKLPHSIMLPPPCFTVGMVPGFFYLNAKHNI